MTYVVFERLNSSSNKYMEDEFPHPMARHIITTYCHMKCTEFPICAWSVLVNMRTCMVCTNICFSEYVCIHVSESQQCQNYHIVWKCVAQFSLNNVHKRGLKHHHFISLYENVQIYWIPVCKAVCLILVFHYKTVQYEHNCATWEYVCVCIQGMWLHVILK